MNQPIKVAFDATPLLANKTGVAYYTERIMAALADRHPDEVDVTGYYYNFLNRKKHALQTLPNLHYRSMFPLLPSKVVFQLRRMGIEFPVELMMPGKHDFVFYPNFLGFPSLGHVGSAPVLHDLTYIDLPEYVSAKLRSDLVRFMPKQISRGKFVVTVSEFSKQRIVEEYGVSPDKVLVTPIPPEKPASHSRADQQTALEKVGVRQPYLLFLGTIEPRKNITSLIDAYLRLPQEVQKKYTLVIAGRIGWNCEKEVAKLKEAKEQGHNITHLGYVDDETRKILYESAHLFVTASHYEGFGMPILEAMSYGVPCAVSDIPVFREVASEGAVFFDQKDVGSIADSLKKLLINPTQLSELSKQAKRHANSYSWGTVADKLFDAIKQTTSSK